MVSNGATDLDNAWARSYGLTYGSMVVQIDFFAWPLTYKGR